MSANVTVESEANFDIDVRCYVCGESLVINRTSVDNPRQEVEIEVETDHQCGEE